MVEAVFDIRFCPSCLPFAEVRRGFLVGIINCKLCRNLAVIATSSRVPSQLEKHAQGWSGSSPGSMAVGWLWHFSFNGCVRDCSWAIADKELFVPAGLRFPEPGLCDRRVQPVKPRRKWPLRSAIAGSKRFLLLIANYFHMANFATDHFRFMQPSPQKKKEASTGGVGVP